MKCKLTHKNGLERKEKKTQERGQLHFLEDEKNSISDTKMQFSRRGNLRANVDKKAKNISYPQLYKIEVVNVGLTQPLNPVFMSTYPYSSTKDEYGSNMVKQI